MTAVAAVCLLVSATISLAADKPTIPTQTAAPKAPQRVMVVPNVTGQLFVFASGMLEDGGFGWNVRGSVGGYPANLVVAQSPAAGTRVIDNGVPGITLTLARRGGQVGQPQNRSPYGASVIRRLKHANSK